MGSNDASRILAKAGIDVEDIKRKLASGEWFVVEGDAECVLSIVEVTRHVAIILFVEGDSALCLAKKTEAFKALTGLSDDVLKKIVWMEVKRTLTGCAAHSTLEEKPEEVAEMVARAILKGAELAEEVLESLKREERPNYIQ
jgi:hypothetical protein